MRVKGFLPSFVLFLSSVMLAFPAVSHGEAVTTQVVEAEGSVPVVALDLARARNLAIRDALQQAVMQVTDRFVDPRDANSNMTLLREQIYSQAERFIQDYRLVFETTVMDVYTVAVRVTVFAGGIRDELLRLGLIRSLPPEPAAKRFALTVRGIRSYGEYVRLQGILKDQVPGIKAAVPREAARGMIRFDVEAEGITPSLADRLRQRLGGEIRRQDERSLEIDLK
ncbi:MAG: flagellar assembly protein T N-terminal domain-containing protein [Thermodesulfobacteriota bacterium]